MQGSLYGRALAGSSQDHLPFSCFPPFQPGICPSQPPREPLWTLVQTSESSVGAAATSGLPDVRKSGHGASGHESWLGTTSRLGNLDIWEPLSVPLRALGQEGGRTSTAKAEAIFDSVGTRRETCVT